VCNDGAPRYAARWHMDVLVVNVGGPMKYAALATDDDGTIA
jgi:hypothetical protein